MYLLRLFHKADPAQPVAAHMLGEGVTQVGRDPLSDWPIPDPECEISRHHFQLVLADGGLALRPLGANGVFRSDRRAFPATECGPPPRRLDFANTGWW